jgi:outer membrane protein assembly factor BamD (BamD/ComL family)
VAAVASAGAAAPAGEVVATTSHLAEEARAVLAARNALRSSDPSSALRALDDARARFPDGSLGQEREALTIEALSRAGRKQAASARARAFLARFPNSPLASNVRRFE